MSVSNDVYNLTGGRIVLSGKTMSDSKWGGMATQVYNWSTQGARDAENNANYDASRRMERTLAVMSCVGSTYEEKRQANALTSCDWNDSAHSAHLNRLGYGNTAQQNAQNMLNNTEWVAKNSTTGISSDISFNIKDLTNAQLNQLKSTGSFMHNGQQIMSKSHNASEVRQVLKSAEQERTRRTNLFTVTNNDQARYNLQQIGAQQKKLLSDISAQYGLKFSGSSKDIHRLEKTLNKERENLVRMGRDTANIDTQLLDVQIAKETGLSANLSGRSKDQAKTAQRRSYGRQIIRQSIAGDEINQGMVFYEQSYKLTKQAICTSYRGIAGLTFGSVANGANVVEKLASGTTLGRGANVVKEKSLEKKNNSKDFGREKSRGEKRALREEKLARHNSKRAEKFAKKVRGNNDKIAVLEQKKTDARLLHKGEFSTRDQRRLDRANKRKERLTRKGGRREAWNQKMAGIRKFHSRIRATKNKISEFFSRKNIFRKIIHFADVIQRYTVLIVGSVILGFILFLVLCGGIASLFPFFASFLSDFSTDLTGALDDVNYVQYIVNETANDLAKQFENVAKHDAETHFLINDPIPSDNNLDWYKSVSEGEIEHIWASNEMNLPESERKELNGVSANLLQITSMMHYRYQDDLGFEEYPTAKAYEYYMFVRTHRVAEDENGNPTYSYETLDNHDASSLYSAPTTYNPGTQTIIRGEESCENIYIHGYNNITFGNDATLALAVNRARATMEGFLTSCVRNIAITNGASFSGGAFTERQAEGLWIDEIPHDSNGHVCDNYIAYPAGYTEDFLYTTGEGGSCLGYEHTHTEACYEFVATGGYYEDGVSPRGYERLICNIEEHTHSNWVSESNPGCYHTAYLCQGHCGGHVCPTINIEVDMQWEDLICYDNFKTPHFISETSFSTILDWGKCKTIEDWAEKWMNRAGEWFSPFPDSPITAVTWLGRNLVYKGAQAIDWLTNEDRADNPTEEDIYGFEGWWIDSNTIDEELLSDLEAFYGTYDTDFKEGIETWKDFDVVFPVGSCPTLTEEQIALILDQVRQGNPGISTRKLSVLEEALRGVGQYYYSLTGYAHNNAIQNTSGAGECSGFVSGVLNRALGTHYDTNAAGYHSYGTSAAPSAGDVIAYKTSGGHASGHVLIFVGFLYDGVEGYKITNQSGTVYDQSGSGVFVIDCTPTYGGSVIRKYSIVSGTNSWGNY